MVIILSQFKVGYIKQAGLYKGLASEGARPKKGEQDSVPYIPPYRKMRFVLKWSPIAILHTTPMVY